MQQEVAITSGDNETNDVTKMVTELVEKYNSVLRVNQLLMEFVHEKQLQEEFLEYLQRRDPLPEKQ